MNTLATPAASALVHPSIHPDERAAREELAACYRVFAMLGWVEMIYNHITVRLPDSVTGGEKQFLINPFGLHYSEVTASNLVKIDLQGKVLDGSSYPVNPAGFVVHAAIHDGLPGAHCVMHTHTTAGVAVACLQGGLQRACEIQMATFSMGAAIPVSEEIARRCTRDALQFSPEHGAGQDVFNALVRQVDRIDPSYRN